MFENLCDIDPALAFRLCMDGTLIPAAPMWGTSTSSAALLP